MKETLLAYAKANVAPILVDFEIKDLNGAILIPSNIDTKELTGHYEGVDYLPPSWFNNLENKVLVIDKIDAIPKEEQLKFKELLEYRKISTFDLPDSTVIIVTASRINRETIDEEIFSLTARI